MTASGDDRAHDTPLVPARIVNEHVYCPRLAWLEWEARAFTDSVDTAEGTDAPSRRSGAGRRRPTGRRGHRRDIADVVV